MKNPSQRKKILLVGCCGMGVGPLGMFLSQMGHEVHGYDDYPVARITDRLKRQGVLLLEHLHGVNDYDEVIVSRAIAGNPDRLNRFKKRFNKARIVFRGDYLAFLSKSFDSVVVAGSHGKTTTTASIVTQLRVEGLSVSYILGAYFEGDALPAAQYVTDSKCLIIEVDESDGTIKKFRPWATVLTNVELDHVDFYRSEKRLFKTFRSLISNTKKKVFVGSGVPEKLGLKENQGPELMKMACNAEGGGFLAENADMAVAVTEWLIDRPFDREKYEFPVVERRQDCRQLGENQWVFTDYAHHPGEIQALREWLEKQYDGFEITWVFQPHRYSRTVALKTEFVKILRSMNPVLLPEYGAFEPVIEEGKAISLYQDLLATGSKTNYCETPEELNEFLGMASQDGDEERRQLVVFAGAGDIELWRDWWLHSIEDSSGNSNCELDSTWVSFHQSRTSEDESYFATNEPLKRKTTLNVGGVARFYAEPASLESLQLVLKTSKLFKLPLFVIGKGSNLLVDDARIEGVVVRLSKPFWRKCESLGNGRYWVGSGLSLKRICRAALDDGVNGFNFMDGIPGSVGGAVRMNAGAMGSEMGEWVKEAECFDPSGKRIRLSHEDMAFAYRNSKGTDGLIILHVLLQGTPGTNRDALRNGLEVYRKKRLFSQPAEPSAGCMFVNPEGDSAGRLIDAAGLKGYTVGGAQVSQKHGNFLVTEKNATSADVEALIGHVKTTVKAQFGVDLHQEIKVLSLVPTGGSQESKDEK